MVLKGLFLVVSQLAENQILVRLCLIPDLLHIVLTFKIQNGK